MSASRVSRETPSQDVPSFDHRVTQCKSTETVSLGRLRNDFQSHRCNTFLPSSITNSHFSSGTCGVGPADNTGKSVVRYCPGGSLTSVGVCRPEKPREMIPMCIPPYAAAHLHQRLRLVLGLAAICRLRGRLGQTALPDNEACDLLDTFAALQIRENIRPIRAHSQRIRFHHCKVCANKRS